MHGSPRGAVVFRSPDPGRCLEMQTALGARGILSEVHQAGVECLLVVDERDRPAALREVEGYRLESDRPPVAEAPDLPLLSGGAAGVVAYVAVLLAVAAAGSDWRPAGSMQAGKVVAGEWWRVFTALTLHLDAAHLLANVVFGAVLGIFAAQALGGGVGWLGIALAGGLGNALNAIVQPPAHSAVGASTAVFGALGVMVAHALAVRRNVPGGRARRWSPLLGGLLLFAFVGIGGARTDVMAHATGLLAGLLVGVAGSLLPIDLLRRRTVQAGAAIAVLSLIAGCWWLALR